MNPPDKNGLEASAVIYAAHPLRLDSSKHIRLIKVVPYASSPGLQVENDPQCDRISSIAVEIQTVPLESAPPYIALSYMWGPPEPSRRISIAGQPLTVRENLWRFLDLISTRGDVGFLWIDALCIDQSSIPERNHQVAMMGQIYRNATKVISWLGAGPPELAEAVRELSVLHRESEVIECVAETLREIVWWGGEPQEEALTPELAATIQTFGPILLDASYWRRAWIAQEVALARELEVWCGGESMSRASLKHWSWLQKRERGIARRIRVMVREFTLFEISTMNICSVLEQFSSHMGECADVKDRIYSILALVNPEDTAGCPLVVDYNQSPYELYCEMVESYRQKHSKFYDWRFAFFLAGALELDTNLDIRRQIGEMQIQALADEHIKRSSSREDQSRETSCTSEDQAIPSLRSRVMRAGKAHRSLKVLAHSVGKAFYD